MNRAGGPRQSLVQPTDEVTQRLTEQIAKFKRVQVSATEVVDVLDQVMEVDDGSGTPKVWVFHQCQAALN